MLTVHISVVVVSTPESSAVTDDPGSLARGVIMIDHFLLEQYSCKQSGPSCTPQPQGRMQHHSTRRNPACALCLRPYLCLCTQKPTFMCRHICIHSHPHAFIVAAVALGAACSIETLVTVLPGIGTLISMLGMPSTTPCPPSRLHPLRSHCRD